MTSDSKPSPAVAPISGSLPSLFEPTQASPPVAAEGPTLLELELHRCTDDVLFRIASFENLQILWAIGFAEELYDNLTISNVGLTILMHRCRRVKLELSSYEGSFDGISTIGPEEICIEPYFTQETEEDQTFQTFEPTDEPE